jgi:hypothetical protein
MLWAFLLNPKGKQLFIEVVGLHYAQQPRQPLPSFPKKLKKV